MNESYFIDGLQNQVRIRTRALPEIILYINSLENPNDIFHPIYSIAKLFSRIKSLIHLNTSDPNALNNVEKEQLEFYHEELLYKDKNRYLSITLYSYAIPIIAIYFAFVIITQSLCN